MSAKRPIFYILLPNKKETMTRQKNQFNLLKGKFNAEDAREVLITLFNDKIQYHRLKNFSHEERFGAPETNAVERIPELKKTLENILLYIRQHHGDTQFEIHADIVIRPVLPPSRIANIE